MQRIRGAIALALALSLAALLGCTPSGGGTTEPSSAVDPKGSPTTGEASAPADGPLGKYDPPITVRTMINSLHPSLQITDENQPEDNVWTRLYRDKLGINLEFMWTATPEQGDEKLNLAISSGEIPDIFMVNGNQFEQLTSAGKLADLTTAYENNAGDFIQEIMKKPGSDLAMELSSRDGKLLGIPFFLDHTDEARCIWIREDWRKKLNLPEPKTFDDVIAIAKAYKDSDPDGNGVADTLGLGMHSDLTKPGAFPMFFNCFHAYPELWMEGPDGKLMNGIADIEPNQRAFAKLNELYTSGLIDKNYASLNYDSDLLPKVIDGKVGVIFGGLWDGWWPLGDIKAIDPECEWRSYDLLSADDKPAKNQASAIAMGSYNVVNANFEHPEALVRMINLVNETMWRSDKDTFFKYGYDSGGNNPWNLSPVYFEFPGKNLRLYQMGTKALETGDTTGLNGEETLIYEWMKAYRDDGDLTRYGVYLAYGPDSSCAKIDTYTNEDRFILNKFYGSSTKPMLDYRVQLDKVYGEHFIKFVSGELPVDQYGAFVEQWLQQGGQQITDSVNEWRSNREVAN